MANLIPIPEWSDVVQYETSTRVRGGAGNEMNWQSQALLNRTEYLKENTSTVFESFGNLNASEEVKVGQIVSVMGRYQNGDGGANYYEIVPADTGAADGGQYIDLEGTGLQAKGLFPSGTMSLKQFGAVGDSVTDDTEAWNNFQAAVGLKIIPRGRYLVDGEIKRFDQGVIGNGVYNDADAAWNQQLGDRERDSILVHGRTINANATLISPAIKTQTTVNYTVNTPSSQFKRITNAYHEATLNGYYNTQTDQNNNFTVMGAAVKNNMAGLFGSLACTWYCQDAKETENPLILEMGATKNGCSYFQPTRRSRYSSGGYMFGTEVIFLNTSDDSDTDIPYQNRDDFAFNAWYVGAKISAQSNSAPATTGILINGSSTAKHGWWNGIVIGSSAFVINNNDQGPAGTVGINMASWRPSAGYGDIGIKFNTANRHLHFNEGAKIHSKITKFTNPSGNTDVHIDAGSGGGIPSIFFNNGATTDPDGGAVTNVAALRATSTSFVVNSISGEVQLRAGTSINYVATATQFSPGLSNPTPVNLGGSNRRWNDFYTNSIILSPGIGTTKTPAANGDIVVEATSDTSITIKMKGSDGIVRGVALALTEME